MDTVPADGPDPWAATTPAEFLRALQELRAWAGQPSLRTLTALAGTVPVPGRPPADVLPVSTLSDNLAGRRLPNLPRPSFVAAFVGACSQAHGYDEEEIAAEVRRWSQAWQALSTAEPTQATQATEITQATEVTQTTEATEVAEVAQASSRSLPTPPTGEPTSTAARHGRSRHRRWRAPRWSPAIAALLGIAIGAVSVWLAMPAHTAKPPSSLPPAATPGARTSAPPGSKRPPARSPVQAPGSAADARAKTTPTPRPQDRPARPKPGSSQAAPYESALRSYRSRFDPSPYQSSFKPPQVPAP